MYLREGLQPPADSYIIIIYFLCFLFKNIFPKLYIKRSFCYVEYLFFFFFQSVKTCPRFSERPFSSFVPMLSTSEAFLGHGFLLTTALIFLSDTTMIIVSQLYFRHLEFFFFLCPWLDSFFLLFFFFFCFQKSVSHSAWHILTMPSLLFLTDMDFKKTVASPVGSPCFHIHYQFVLLEASQ